LYALGEIAGYKQKTENAHSPKLHNQRSLVAPIPPDITSQKHEDHHPCF